MTNEEFDDYEFDCDRNCKICKLDECPLSIDELEFIDDEDQEPVY